MDWNRTAAHVLIIANPVEDWQADPSGCRHGGVCVSPPGKLNQGIDCAAGEEENRIFSHICSGIQKGCAPFVITRK